jgi:hydrogenase-4 component B
MNFDLYRNLLVAMGVLIISAIITPILSSKRKLAGWINFILIAASSVFLFNISVISMFGSEGGEGLPMLHFGPIGIYFFIDGFSGFFIAIISFMAVISAFYSIQYMEHYKDYKLWSYYLSFPLFVLGMIGIVTVDVAGYDNIVLFPDTF